MTTNTVNEAFERALEAAEIEGRELELAPEPQSCLKAFGETAGPGDDWVVCAIIAHRSNENDGSSKLRTKQGTDKFYGGSVIGPTAKMRPGTLADIKNLAIPNHWVFNPAFCVGRGDGTLVSTTTPSLVPTHLVRIECPSCGDVKEEWRETAIMHAADKKPGGVVKCEKCGADLVPSKVVTTVNQIVGNPDTAEQMADMMLRAWHAGPPKDNVAEIETPRLWCAYADGLAPIAPDDWNWDMADGRARELIKRASMFKSVDGTPNPLDILPWSVAKANNGLSGEHSPAALWIEIPHGIQVGWIRLASLRMRKSAGWTCRMTNITARIVEQLPAARKRQGVRRIRDMVVV